MAGKSLLERKLGNWAFTLSRAAKMKAISTSGSMPNWDASRGKGRSASSRLPPEKARKVKGDGSKGG